MEYIAKILLLIISFSIAISAENQKFDAPVAAQIEARIGTYYLTDDDKMRLDIGNSFDMLTAYNSEKLLIMSGADLMTYTRLRSVGKFKFPVETTDYYFGVNSSFVFKSDKDFFWTSRIRVAHISSHLIDGLAKNGIFERMPYVYSREFVDIIAAFNLHKKEKVKLKVYGGANFVFSTIPDKVNMFEPQFGVDLKHKFLTDNLEFIIAYDIRLLGQNNNFTGSNSLQTGINYLTSETKSIFFGYYFYAGQSMHGMFISDYDKYHGLGVQIYY